MLNSLLLGGNPKSRPSPQQRPGFGSSGCGLLFGFGWTSFSLLFVIIPIMVLITEWQTADLLRTTGVTTEAVLIDRRMVEDSEGNAYYVTYRYRVPVKGDQMQLTHEESVDQESYQALTLESRVPVRYSATDPEVVRLADQSNSKKNFLTCFSLFGGGFVLIGLWLIYTGGREIHKAWLLGWRGKTATGRVTDCWTQTDSEGDTEYCVAFAFAEPGRPEIISAEYNRQAYRTLQVGDPVQVRYVPDQPRICRLDQ